MSMNFIAIFSELLPPVFTDTICEDRYFVILGSINVDRVSSLRRRGVSPACSIAPDRCGDLLPCRVLSFRCEFIEMIRPPLHHLAAFGQVLGVVVGGADAVGFGVS